MSDEADRVLCACGRIFIRQPNDFDAHKTTCMYYRIDALANENAKLLLQVKDLETKWDQLHTAYELENERKADALLQLRELQNSVARDKVHMDSLRQIIKERDAANLQVEQLQKGGDWMAEKLDRITRAAASGNAAEMATALLMKPPQIAEVTWPDKRNCEHRYNTIESNPKVCLKCGDDSSTKKQVVPMLKCGEIVSWRELLYHCEKDIPCPDHK